MIANDTSSSGEITEEAIRTSPTFEHIQHYMTSGHSKLLRAQRYGQWYMLKTLRDDLAGNTFYEELLHKEFEIAIQLSHTNIVRTLSMEEVEGVGYCIVMDYVDGRTLSDYLKEHHSHSQRRKIAEQILNALEHCHAHQIIHRDIKPNNIMITTSGNNVRIIDFGLSDTDSFAILKQPAGTPHYSAPEQFAGEQIDNRADIYAFGKLLHQIFPHRYIMVAQRCTRSNPTQRYATASDVAAAMHRSDILLWLLPTAAVVTALALALPYSPTTQPGPQHPAPQPITITLQTPTPAPAATKEKGIRGKESSFEDATTWSKEIEYIFEPFDERVSNGEITSQEAASMVVSAMYVKALYELNEKHLPDTDAPDYAEIKEKINTAAWLPSNTIRTSETYLSLPHTGYSEEHTGKASLELAEAEERYNFPSCTKKN